VHKANTTDDKRLQSTLKRLGVNNIPGIEEVNLFRDNEPIIHFANPKVQASLQSNTYVISGHAEEKNLQDLLPGILPHLGRDNIDSLKKIAERFKAGEAAGAAAGGDDAGEEAAEEKVEEEEEEMDLGGGMDMFGDGGEDY